MRPLRLELEGFTSFKERLALDFDGLDLFAITGPTGAGKSSLIDAIVFALYGQVPRVGREYKQLISHGAERLSVKLDFEVGKKRYRVARTARVNGNPQTVLEEQTTKGFEPLAGRVKEIEDAIQQIVGLDYDAFTRSVVLPQGQFDAFLKGEPKERRKILVALLNLGVYEDMHQIANRRAMDARREADFVANQLAGDFMEATPIALAARRLELGEAQVARERSSAALATVACGLAAAQRAAASKCSLEQVVSDLAAERARIEKAAATLTEAGARRDALAVRQADLARKLEGVRVDAPRLQTLLAARPKVEQLAALLARRERIDKTAADHETALTQASTRLREAAGQVPDLERRVADAEGATLAARTVREGLHRRHAALELRRHVEPGGPCPVCEQAVRVVPKAAAALGLDGADAAVLRAEKATNEARRHLSQGQLAVEQARGAAQRLTDQGKELSLRRDELRSELGLVQEALAAAGFKPLELADPTSLLSLLSEQTAALEAAHNERDRLEAERQKLERACAELQASVAGAQAQVESARQRASDLESRQGACQDAFEAARAELDGLAQRAGWALGPTCDPVSCLERERATLDRGLHTATTLAARLEALVERLEKDIARAAELAEKKKTLEETAALANALAQHLRADQLLGYIQEEALRLLAEDGSRRLEALSHGRYSLVVDEQEFEVIDHWNAESRRSVKTLSGGETFLASLALALALAEGLAELAAEGRAGEALESLFLDEGFGTLDPDALSQVVQALDALHGGDRLVGVITHLPELAAQLPARLEVHRHEGTARVTIG